MPWKPETVMEQKVEFVVRAKSGEECLSELCAEYGISRPTGYLWLRRYEENGTIAGLTERSRRPHRSPKRTSSEWEARVLQLRDEKGWGARKLAFVLAKRGVSLHTQTVHRILERHGRIREGESVRLAVRRFAREQCNELAQMDFKGEYQLNEGKCYPLSLLDDCSRYLLGLWPLSSTGAEGVYRTLKAHFKSVGVPQAMLVDHGTPWYGTTSQHGLTWLSVWLIKQGVRLTYSGGVHPQTQGN